MVVFGASRRRFQCTIKRFSVPTVSLLLLSFIALSCREKPAATPGLTQVVLQTDWYPQPEHGGFYTALVEGYYKEEGLDVTIQPGGPYMQPYQQVAAGAAQFGMGGSDKILESVASGQKLLAVAATLQHDPQGIMVRESSGVKAFGDLSGHSVAVTPGSTWFRYLVERYKLHDVRETPAMMSVANFIANPDYIQQAFATSEPFFARQAGAQPRFLLVSDAGFAPYRVMFTTQDFAREHPDVVAKFVRASIRGWHEYLNDPKAADDAVAKLNPALTPEWMKFSWKALRDGKFVAGDDASGAKIGQMETERWNAIYKQLLELKVIDKEFDPATAYTLEFIPKN
ncbi:MAG TPA: ABC transporter substrate-binding protein [Candidatus Acidoferrum sp.]|nr:ABC transporter substrate-binding protein [Candidatus Acidoferrum sp.]